MAKTVYSNLKCVLVLEDVRIKPTSNPLITEKELEKLLKHKDFKALVKNNDILLVDADAKEELVEEEVKVVEEMTVSELKVLAKEKGISGVGSMSKAELLESLTEADAE